jgi:cytoskeletal protein RodZ
MAAETNTSQDSLSLPPLAQHRKRNGVTLAQIAESTKISVRFLRAIEAEDFSHLPGGIFARSYIRQYAAAIGFDEEQLLARYRNQVGKEEDDTVKGTPAPTPMARKRSGRDWFRALSPIRFP